MRGHTLLKIFIFTIIIQIISIYPLYSYKEFFNTRINNINGKDISYLMDSFKKVWLNYSDILRENDVNIDNSKVFNHINNMKDTFQVNQAPLNIYNYMVNTLANIISNPLTGAISGGLAGPVLGALFGSGIVLAFDAGLSGLEILVLTLAGALITGLLGAGLGGALGAGIGAIFTLGSALAFAVIGGLVGIFAGLIFGIILLPLLPLIIIILPIVFALLGGIIGGAASSLISLLLLLPVGGFIGAILGGATGAAIGAIGGLAISAVEQILFLPTALLIAAIGAVIGLIIGPPIGGVLGYIIPNQNQQANNTQNDNNQENSPEEQPVNTIPSFPPNVDNLTPRTPVLPTGSYVLPYSVDSKVLDFLHTSEQIIYSHDKTIFTDLKGTLIPILNNYSKIFNSAKVKRVSKQICNILNNSDLNSPDGINNATTEILKLIPEPHSH
jgi:hypothetical protein